MPSLLQILDGRPPARNGPIRVEFVPGSEWHYSGDGYLVAQQLMVDLTGEAFPAFMRSAVFDRLGMHDSTYEQPPTGRSTHAADDSATSAETSATRPPS